jgi:DNA-binding transcriptional MocR family regulator
VRLAGQAGVKLTPAGATFPYGRDPRDRNIRIAPSLPPLEQIEVAMEVVAVSVALVSVNRLLG